MSQPTSACGNEKEVVVDRLRLLKIHNNKDPESTGCQKADKLNMLRPRRQRNRKEERQRHYSAPDLSFGRTMDLSILSTDTACDDDRIHSINNNILEKFNNERPVRPVVRRASLTMGPSLEEIAETAEGIEGDSDCQSSTAEEITNLPPILENTGSYGPQPTAMSLRQMRYLRKNRVAEGDQSSRRRST